MLTRRSLSLGLGLAAMPFGRASANQSYPTRPVRLLVPYAAGGGTDAIARLVAQGVSEKLGQSMVVENNGAAGGNIATVQAAAAEPDGYTVLMANQGPMVVNPHLFGNLKIDPLAAFLPITLIAEAALVLVTPKESRFKNLAELVEFGRKNPGKLTYGSAGKGSASHLATVLLAQQAKFDAVHVPYRGAGPALNDLLGGRTDFMITTLPSVAGLIDGEQVGALAVTGKARVKKLPQVPTIAEAGWPGYVATAWYGFVVPKGTPEPIVSELRKATVAALDDATIRARLEQEGAEIVGNMPADFAAMMKLESERWSGVIREASLKAD